MQTFNLPFLICQSVMYKLNVPNVLLTNLSLTHHSEIPDIKKQPFTITLKTQSQSVRCGLEQTNRSK